MMQADMLLDNMRIGLVGLQTENMQRLDKRPPAEQFGHHASKTPCFSDP